MKAATLYEAFAGNDDFGPLSDFVVTDLPPVDYESIPISELEPDNPKGFDLTGSIAWYRKGTLATVKRVKFQILKDSPDCTIYFLRNAPNMMIKLNGSGHSVFNLSGNKLSLKLRMTGGEGDDFKGCRVIIGENTFMGGVEATLLNTDFVVKKKGLWSDGILVQGSNQHGIVDRKTMRLVKTHRNRIILEPHVWIGRRAILTSAAHIGAGSVVGTAAVATKQYPGSCIIAGNPGRVIKENMTWANSLSEIGKVERDIIDEFVQIIPDPPTPAAPTIADKLRDLGRSIWLKGAVAGVGGAVIFEAIQEVLALD